MHLLILILPFACNTPSEQEQSVEQTTVDNSSMANTTSGPKKNKGFFDPLEGKTLKQICESAGLSLIKWSFAERQEKQKGYCCGPGGMDPDECQYDWPSSDVMPCEEYDWLRNSIYAQYGREFKTAKWSERFKKEPWYKIRADYSDAWVSSTATANAKLLLDMKKQCDKH